MPVPRRRTIGCALRLTPHDFARLAADAEAAAMKKDGAAFSTTANALGDTCTACHAKHKPQG